MPSNEARRNLLSNERLDTFWDGLRLELWPFLYPMSDHPLLRFPCSWLPWLLWLLRPLQLLLFLCLLCLLWLAPNRSSAGGGDARPLLMFSLTLYKKVWTCASRRRYSGDQAWPSELHWVATTPLFTKYFVLSPPR